MRTPIFLILIIQVLLISCGNNGPAYDATGTFEANDIIVSAGAMGNLSQLKVEEGMEVQAGEVVGFIDTAQLYLKKLQLQAQIRAVLSRQPDVSRQIAIIQEQILTANREKVRVENLFRAGAATQKQLDDLNAQISILQKQLDAQQSTLQITSESISMEVAPLTYQIAQIDDQLINSYVTQPVNGTVLLKYAEENEFVTPGKAIYKTADLDMMTLRAYITGDLLPLVQINQPATVFIDGGAGELVELKGTVAWIADKAEFTPKTIQTKDERANLVYAVKIRVPNNGSIKIGMYGEVLFAND
jgi:HlyD family secretion protein